MSSLRENLNQRQVKSVRQSDDTTSKTKTGKSTRNNAESLRTQNNPISELLEEQLYSDLFNARCHDTGEGVTRKSIPPSYAE